MNIEKRSKKEAIESGLKTYIRDSACNNCGSFEFYTSSNNCADCARSRAKNQWRKPGYAAMDSERRRIARNSDPEKMARKREGNKRWADKNPEKTKAAIKRWGEENRSRLRAKSNEWRRKKYRDSPEYRMRVAMSAMVRRVLSRGNRVKDASAEHILGYTRHDLVSHIERQFTKKMTWDNYGTYWHIDHIIPVSVLVDNGEDAAKVNCLSNLRPISAEINQRKSNKIEVLI